MKLNRLELLEALERARGSIATRDIIPILTSFRFTPDRVEATNFETGASVKFKTGLDCIVPAERFYKLVSMLWQDEIDLLGKDGRIAVKAKGHSSSMAVLGDEEFPVISEGKRSWKKAPADFIDALKACLPGVSTDVTQAKLCGVFVDGKDVVSCDRWRMYHHKMKGKMPFSALWPTALVEEVVKWGEPDGVDLDKDSDGLGTICLKYGDDLLTGRLIDAEFPPKWEGMFPKEAKLVDFPGDEMKNALERMGAFADEQEGIIVSFKDGKACLSYKDIEIEMEEKVEFGKAERKPFGVNPNLLASLIGDDMKIGFAEEGNDVVYFERGKNFRCMIACMKTKEEDE